MENLIESTNRLLELICKLWELSNIWGQYTKLTAFLYISYEHSEIDINLQLSFKIASKKWKIK